MQNVIHSCGSLATNMKIIHLMYSFRVNWRTSPNEIDKILVSNSNADQSALVQIFQRLYYRTIAQLTENVEPMLQNLLL